MKRKRRPGEYVCNCGAYKFPHRMMGGECDGGLYVSQAFEKGMWGACRGCPGREVAEDRGEVLCVVLDGREPTRHCEQLQGHIAYEGIKLYGVNKPPPKRALRFRR